MIPLLVRTQIAVDDPVSENAVPMLEWLAYVTEAVPGCHGDGDPQVIGPTLVRLLHSFTRARVGPEILELVADVAGKQLHLMSRRDMAAFGVLVADLVAAAGDLIRLQHVTNSKEAAGSYVSSSCDFTSKITYMVRKFVLTLSAFDFVWSPAIALSMQC